MAHGLMDPASVDLDHLPDIELRQMLSLTDDTGILQHARYAAADPHHGYCVDDNCRALIAALLHAHLRGYDEARVPVHRYLAFMAYAFNAANGRFRNFMSYDRRWLEEVGSDDSHGRTMWALGMAVELAPQEAVRGLARQLFDQALPAAEKLPHLRSRAFTLLGLDSHLAAQPHDANAHRVRRELAEDLLDAWRRNSDDAWPWWEDTVTYDNAKLPHALLLAGRSLGRDDMIEVGLKALRWLLEVQTAGGPTLAEGHLSIIGNEGWLRRDGARARFDQQPLEAHAMVSACLAAAEVTDESVWVDRALRCFAWFLGDNDLGVPLYNPQSGGCHDGLMAQGVNSNQGAESTLAYTLSVLELHAFRARHRDRVQAAAPRTLGLAVVGASRFAAFCLESYAGIEGLQPVAVTSRRLSSAQRLAQRFDLTACERMDDLLADPSVHLVHVASIPADHADAALRALRAGKHVLCEKPIATSLDDCGRMQQAAVERDRRLSVNFMMRYGPLWPVMRRVVHEDLLGAPLRGQVTNCAGDAGLPDDHWFWDPALSGGIFVEHGVHFFDLLQSWLGPSRVLTARKLRRPDAGYVDQCFCEVLYHNDATVNFYHGFHQSPPLDRQDVRLIFEHGRITLAGWVADTLELSGVVTDGQFERLLALLPGAEITRQDRLTGEQRLSGRRSGREAMDLHVELRWCDGREKQAVYAAALRDLMTDFVASVRDPGHSPRVTAADGRAALELAVAAEQLAGGNNRSAAGASGGSSR